MAATTAVIDRKTLFKLSEPDAAYICEKRQYVVIELQYVQLLFHKHFIVY